MFSYKAEGLKGNAPFKYMFRLAKNEILCYAYARKREITEAGRGVTPDFAVKEE